MKKLILSVGLALISLQAFPQSGGLGGATTPTDTSNNPSGVGFGGAMGGATSTTPAAGAGTTTTPQSDTTFGIPRATDPATQQREEERFNFAGGALGGQTTTPGQATPSTTAPAQPSLNVPPTQPTNIPQQNVPSATGVGTGAPTSF